MRYDLGRFHPHLTKTPGSFLILDTYCVAMAFMYDIVFDQTTGRHRLEFINQQFDYLMGIVFNEATGCYELSVSEEEAKKISRQWGRSSFNVQEWIEYATRELTESDRVREQQKSRENE